MTYSELIILGQTIPPGDRTRARDFLTHIAQTLDSDTLTKNERRRLYKLQERWTTRADGLDLRWEVLGSKPGRRKGESTQRPVLDSSGTPEQAEPDDPLYQSIAAKFGALIEGKRK